MWPLILYAILAILRNKFPPIDVPDCESDSAAFIVTMCDYFYTAKYRAYALPSAGTLPFLQTLFCDLGGGKDEDPFSDMPTFPNAT